MTARLALPTPENRALGRETLSAALDCASRRNLDMARFVVLSEGVGLSKEQETAVLALFDKKDGTGKTTIDRVIEIADQKSCDKRLITILEIVLLREGTILSWQQEFSLLDLIKQREGQVKIDLQEMLKKDLFPKQLLLEQEKKLEELTVHIFVSMTTL